MLHLISMNQPLEFVPDVKIILLASYYCREYSENICEQCFDAHKKVKLTKKTYFGSFSNVKTKTKKNTNHKTINMK